jgi:hypothetical protein
MIFKIYDTVRMENSKTVYDIRITWQDEILYYYGLTASEYTMVLATFRILEQRKYKVNI